MNFCESKYDQFCPASYTSDKANHSPTEAGNKNITKLLFELMLPFQVIFSKPFMDAADPFILFFSHTPYIEKVYSTAL